MINWMGGEGLRCGVVEWSEVEWGLIYVSYLL